MEFSILIPYVARIKINLFCKAAGDTHGDGITDGEIDEHFSRVILFEDISDYMFSLTSEEARLSLLYQFIDFYGGKISQWLVFILNVYPELLSFSLVHTSQNFI